MNEKRPWWKTETFGIWVTGTVLIVLTLIQFLWPPDPNHPMGPRFLSFLVGLAPWIRLIVTAVLPVFTGMLGYLLATKRQLKTKSPSRPQSKLTIHEADYRAIEGGGEAFSVGDCLAHLVAGDGLIFQIENHNFAVNGKNYVPNDPKASKEKRLRVVYSFMDGPKVTIERPEHTLLVLPEDEFLKRQCGFDQSSESIHSINFDYLPVSPLEKGWSQVYNEDGKAEFGMDPDMPGSLRMKVLKSEVAIHYNLPPHATRADHLEFTAKYTNAANPTMIFTRLVVSNKDRSAVRSVDIKYYPAGDNQILTKPTNSQSGQDPNRWLPEQTVHWPAPILSGEILLFRIDLLQVVIRCFGNRGWTLQSIQGIRLRGNLSVSSLVLSKMQR
ncbi:MAG TPA: hypothetical protein VMU48_15105 [Terracidiphilus sp.]|nr:hypothetical protein [Terracidiphilus sp.]